MSKRTLAIIPAKGRSRRLPRKNMRPVMGQPLLYHSITAAKNCPLIEDVFVSTDDEEIAAFARSLGAEVPFLRDAALSGDDVHGTEPVLDMLEKLSRAYDEDEYCVRLLPPYPFLKSSTITAVVEKSHAHQKNVLSVIPLDLNTFHLRTVDERGVMHPVSRDTTINFQIEDAPELYALSGAVQCASISFLLRERSYQRGEPLAHSIDKLEGFEIDTADALALAEDIAAARATRAAP